LIGGVVLAAGGSVLAAAGGSSSTQSAAATQYCPDGTPKPPSGDCTGHGGNGNGNPGNPGGPGDKPGKPPKKKHKKPKFWVHQHPKHSCYSGRLAFRIGVSNRPSGHKKRVYLDGRMIRMTGSKAFKLHFNTARMRRGYHAVTLRLRGSDGKWYARTVRFRRC
jgi:hypothetical protein